MKHILITGSTRGIGFGLASRFIEADCQVTINGTTAESVNTALQKLKNAYPSAKVQGLVGDVGNSQDVEMLWDNAIKSFGKIDIWINNAGIDQERENVWDIEPTAFERMVKTNVLGIFNGSTVAFKRMLKQGKGQIFNMEGFGSDGMMREKMTLYGTTKSAVRYFTRSLAKEASTTPIMVGTLSPGMVLTDFLLKSIKVNSEETEKNKKVFNILADEVDTVTKFLSQKILENKINNAHIAWLTKGKVIWRFASSPFNKRNVLERVLEGRSF